MKRTPLYDAHRALGARFVDFGGWEMPVQYTGIIEEHHAVRQRAGLVRRQPHGRDRAARAARPRRLPRS